MPKFIARILAAALVIISCEIVREAGSAGVGISIPPDQVDPEEVQSDGKSFFQYRPTSDSPLPPRDLELHLDSLYVYLRTGATFLSPEFQRTLDKFAATLADPLNANRNPFGAPYTDIRLIHDYFHPEGTIYNPNPSAVRSFLFGRVITDPETERGHVDAYIYRSGPGGGGSGSQPSALFDLREDFSTGGALWHGNSLMIGGPSDASVIDTLGSGWTAPDRVANWALNHEFAHGLAQQPGGWSTETFSGGAEAVGGAEPGSAAVIETPYTWSLLAARGAFQYSSCDSAAQIGSNYPARRLLASYLAFNFRGADTSATLPTGPGDHQGLGDDLLYY
ncbi:MAG: hypothetical protein A2W26_10240 [Acidobacteria bacterium RBG_16_64_8]|nr:MAG: hypothetical protein A2W26_10240 [Acidobacteria bacterium RBG_16_64_8]